MTVKQGPNIKICPKRQKWTITVVSKICQKQSLENCVLHDSWEAPTVNVLLSKTPNFLKNVFLLQYFCVATFFCWQKQFTPIFSLLEYLTGKINRRHVKMFSQLLDLGKISTSPKEDQCVIAANIAHLILFPKSKVSSHWLFTFHSIAIQYNKNARMCASKLFEMREFSFWQNRICHLMIHVFTKRREANFRRVKRI